MLFTVNRPDPFVRQQISSTVAVLAAWRESAETQRVLTTAISKPTYSEQKKTGMKEGFTGQIMMHREENRAWPGFNMNQASSQLTICLTIASVEMP